MTMFLKGKIPLFPSLIKGRQEIRRIFERCQKEKSTEDRSDGMMKK
jgi:hypothetical protein